MSGISKRFDLGAESQDEAVISIEALEVKRLQLASELECDDNATNTALRLNLAQCLLDMDSPSEAWTAARDSLEIAIKKNDWAASIEACDLLFRCDLDDSLIALGHGLWLSITFPVPPTLTIEQLRHVVDETPEDSDGAAVAAAMAGYVLELRAPGADSSDDMLEVGQLLNDVASRHGGVSNPEEFDAWFQRLELDQPEKLIVRMRNIIDVLVQDQWWIDRDALQRLIPGPV